MNRRLISSSLVVFLLVLALAEAALGQSQLTPPPVPSAEADVPVVTDEVAEAIQRLDAWLGQNENAARWRRFLGTADLQRELGRGRDADPAVVGRVLQRLRGGERGLELGPFTNLRDALERRVDDLADQYTGDLTELAWTSREDYRAMSQADLEDVRTTLRNRANQLMQWLGGDSQRAQRWRAYLKWDFVEPHLQPGYNVTPRSLAELDESLEQFQMNVYGLEMAPFRQTAEALARYRILAPWAVAGTTRNTRADYERLLDTLRTQLQRHVEEPTTETTWKIGRILTTIDQLDRSPWLISLIRRRFAQPNITAAVSEQLTRSLEDEPANQVAPVRDCILGTRIVGTANTRGDVRYELQPSDDSVQLALYVTGAAHSRTNGYNGPVRISSTGTTPFTAFKQINLDETAFRSTPAVVTADTNTRIHSIQTINGKFGERLVEKIAWRRAMEQKRQAERISAQHAEQRIASEINQRTDEQLAQLRRRYEQQFLAPLARRAITPERIDLSSTANSVGMTTTFARPNQLAAPGDPPVPRPGNDILVQVHQSAVNNYLPLALARARISQQSADRPIDLEGNVPNWLRAMAIVAPEVAAAVDEGIEVVEETQEAVEELTQPEEEEGAEPRALPPFRPYSITLNAEAPASVWFDDGRVKIRIRASHLVSEENEYTNWDFIVTYDVIRQNEQIILRRVGEIEVFPTGFDPEWDKQLTGQQAGFRSTLAKNMNARAEAGESFPKEIPIQPLQVTRLGVLLVNELTIDDGWLTVGWILPPRGPVAPEGAGILQAPETPIVP